MKTLHRDGSLSDTTETKPHPIARLLPGGSLDQAPRSIKDPDIAQGVVELVVKADGIMHRFELQSKVIKTDPHLTAKGQRAALIDAAKSTLAELGKVMPPGYGDNMRIMEEKLREVPNAPTQTDVERLTAVLLQQEVRQHLRTIIDVELAGMYLSACESGADPLMVAAVESAPKSWPLLPQDVIDKGRQRQYQQRDPETAQRLSDVRAARSYLESTINGLRRQVSEAADLMPPTSDGGQAA